MTGNASTERPDGKQRAAQARCDAIVRHARAQIIEVGVDAFSLAEVLRRAGGSKATFAKYFGDRNGLIAAAISAEARDAVVALHLDRLADLPLEQALAEALEGVLRFYLDPASLGLYRAVIGAAEPKGAADFYEHGHQVIVAALADLLEGRKDRELAADADTRDLADQLLHAVRAGAYERALIGLADDLPDAAAIAARVQGTVAMFLGRSVKPDRP